MSNHEHPDRESYEACPVCSIPPGMLNDIGYADAIKSIAEEAGPESAALLASIQEQNARDIIHALPTWEQLNRKVEEARELGRAEGYAQARAELYDRLFGDDDASS